MLRGEGPLFFLSRCQTITEGAPLQFELLVGHGTVDNHLVVVALAFLHPGIVQCNAIAVFLFIDELAVDEFVGLIHSPCLQDLVIGNDTIDDVHILVRRTHLNSNRRPILIEHVARYPQPVVGLCGRLRIFYGEHHEILLQRVALTDGLHRMFATLQAHLRQFYLLLRGPVTPHMKAVYLVFHVGIDILACGIAQMEGHRGFALQQHLILEIETQRGLAVTQRQRENP